MASQRFVFCRMNCKGVHTFGLVFVLTVLILNVLACVVGMSLGGVLGYDIAGGLLAILATVLSVSAVLIGIIVWRMIRRSQIAKKSPEKG